MAPEVVDLISDDDEEVEVAGSSGGRTHKSPLQTTNLTSIPRLRHPLIPSTTRSSTASSHTEQEHDLTAPNPRDSSLSPLFVPAISPSVALSPRSSRDKGKGRAAPIPEIDLSQDTDDDNNINQAKVSDPTWDYANGEFTEKDALKQAIALSLQEQHDDDDHIRAENGNRDEDSSLTTPPTEKNADITPLPNWHSSPTKPALSDQNRRDPTGPTSTASTAHKGVSSAADTVKVFTASSTATAVESAGENGITADHQTVSNPFSLAGLDRKQMEAERLARMKRKHEGTQLQEQEGPTAKVAKVTKITTPLATSSLSTAVSPPPLKPRVIPTSMKERRQDAISLDDRDDNDSSSSRLYPKGVALKTYLAGFPSTQTISFQDLISPSSHLESALLSSFIWSFDWLFPHFETRRTKFNLVMHAKSRGEREALSKDFQGVPNVRLTFPPMDGNVNCMHSKLMLLFYKDEKDTQWKGGQRCRLVVPTANLVDFDWGVGGFMENMAWLIDLPLKDTAGETRDEEIGFQKSLNQFLKAQSVSNDVIRKLEQFDFSETARYGFVHTIGGIHSGQTWRTTGLCGLGRTLTEHGLSTKENIQMDYVTSSVGSLNDDFMSSMYLAAQGDDGLTEYTRRTNKKPVIGSPLGQWKDRFRLYFPSDDTVRGSRGGARNAGTICFSTKWWQNEKFPRTSMLDCVSLRDRILMHNKLLFTRYTSRSDILRSGKTGWAYVGSANLSESAWGRLVQDRVTKGPRLNCRNWECGVIIPVEARSSDLVGDSIAPRQPDLGLTLFTKDVPVPMGFPGQNMQKKKPWTTFEA